MAPRPRDRTRTALGRRIERALTALNDQYCFFLFLEAEFIGGVVGTGPDERRKFTTEVFVTNPYASRIHVPLERLQEFQQRHRGATFAAYFSTSYEVASSFFDEALITLRTTNTTSLVLPRRRREGPEEWFWRTLQASGYALPAEEIIQTITFFRYRRNASVHLASAPTPSYVAHALQFGAALNSFWRRAGVQIDFRNPATGALTEVETLDALKLFRIVVQRLDTFLSSVLDGSGVARIEAARLFGGKKVRLNTQVIEDRVRTLGALLARDYGISVPGTDIVAAVRAANPRSQARCTPGYRAW